MSRTIGPKAKLSRRLKRNLFLKGARSFSGKDDYAKRPFKPGVHGNAKGFAKISGYGQQLLEKQALRYTYGLTEKQLSKVFKQAMRSKDETGFALLSLLERRLDNVVYRAGLANSRNQARQLVNHGHFNINGVRADIPSITVEAGDVIEIKENKGKKPFWTNFKLEIPKENPAWLSTSNKKIKVINEPLVEDLPKEFNIGYIIEFYARKVK